MLRRTLIVATLMSAGSGCTSSDFAVPVADDASNSETANIDGSTDDGGAGETVLGPCDPEPGKAKYCIEVKLAKPDHPPYTMGSGATGLGIDGSGRVIVVLWDRDPADTPVGGMPPEPKHVIPYPSETSEINVDTGLPVTVSGQAEPGTYTIASLFADNLSAPRVKGEVLPGDFVVLPSVVSGKAAYPKIKLELGTVQKATLELRPNRRVSATFGLDSGLITYAQPIDTVHGDGPVMLAIFDKEWNDFSGYLDVSVSKCFNTKIQTSPTGPIIDYTTTVEGSHNVMMALFDYETTPFPGKGSLVSKRETPYPRIDIRSDSWTTSVVVNAVEVAFGPHDSSKTDPLTCP